MICKVVAGASLSNFATLEIIYHKIIVTVFEMWVGHYKTGESHNWSLPPLFGHRWPFVFERIFILTGKLSPTLILLKFLNIKINYTFILFRLFVKGWQRKCENLGAGNRYPTWHMDVCCWMLVTFVSHFSVFLGHFAIVWVDLTGYHWTRTIPPIDKTMSETRLRLKVISALVI